MLHARHRRLSANRDFLQRRADPDGFAVQGWGEGRQHNRHPSQIRIRKSDREITILAGLGKY